MAGLFTKIRKPQEPESAPQVPDGQRVYCVGDIHGRADLLEVLHDLILADAAVQKCQKTIVYLGDYVDRGEQSCEVIEILLRRPLADFTAIYLLGNHEQILLEFMEHPEATAAWLSFGGRETLNSYGITLAHIPVMQEVPALAAQLQKALPPTHLEFFQNCAHSWQCGDYYFVHAGIRPGVALDKQIAEDQIWIRDDFLYSDRDHGAVIVHGHTISTQPEILPNRIGIDTGAFTSGVLTCLVLEGSEQWFLQTGQGV